MSLDSKLGLRPWQWGLRARIMWAWIFCRGEEALVKVTEHILQSHRVQRSDLAGAQKGRDRFEVLSMAAERMRSVPGMAVEFGVFEGVTLRHIAKAIGPDRRVTGFDTFEGLPDDWGKLLRKGTFATSAPSFEGYSNVGLEVGRIEETLPVFLESHGQSISLVHIDCPYYDTNMFILERVLPRMPDRSIIVFDEYYGYPSYEDHEFRAWSEIRARFNLVASPLAYSSHSAAFELVRNPQYSS
jgi:predicted O-methyltransferase YrrM